MYQIVLKRNTVISADIFTVSFAIFPDFVWEYNNNTNYSVKQERWIMDDSSKGGLTEFWKLLVVTPCASKDFKYR